MADHVETIQDEAVKQIKEIGPSLESAIVEHLANTERDRRKMPIVLGLENLRKLDLEIKKTDKESMVFLLADGEKVMGKTPAVVEAVKKLTDKREKLVKAINKAFEEGELNELNQLNQSFGKGGDKPDGQNKTEGKPEGSGESS